MAQVHHDVKWAELMSQPLGSSLANGNDTHIKRIKRLLNGLV